MPLGTTRSCARAYSYRGIATAVAALGLLVLVTTGARARTEPGTIITFGPTGTVDRNLATFAFVGDPAAADPTVADPTAGDPFRYKCSIDGAPLVPCVSPATFGGLTDGTHRLTVQAFAKDGTALEPATWEWAIDTSALTRITSGPSGEVTSSLAVFEFVSSAPEARFVCSLDGSPRAPCVSPLTFPHLVDGPHEFSVAALDERGDPDPEPARRAFVVAVPKTDLCPTTPGGSRELHQGCAAHEIVARPHAFTEPALALLEAARKRFRADSYRKVAAGLGHAADLLDQAGEQMGGARVCQAAATAQRAVGELDEAEGSMAAAAQAELDALPPDDRDAEDATDGSLAHARLVLARQLLKEETAGARGAATAFQAACRAVRGPLMERGTIIAVDDAARLVILDTGRRVVVSKEVRGAAVVEGAVVSFEGLAFSDSTAAATEITGATATYQGLELACIDLRIAPVQPLPPYGLGPFVLHRVAAYEVNAALRLERRMGVAAVQLGCPTMTADGDALHYSMQVEMTQQDAATIVAFDLRDGDAPVPMPELSPYKPIWISATAQRIRCHPQIGVCEPPEVIHTDSWTAYVRAVGSYASANYWHTVHGVIDNGVPGDFEPNEVVDFTLSDEVAQGAVDTTFSAEGYAVQGLGTSWPAIATIGAGQQFAVLETDFMSPDNWVIGMPGQLEGGHYFQKTGQTWPSALRWAHVSGKRNGWTFSYYALLPQLVRDRVTACGQLPASTLPAGDAVTCSSGPKQVPANDYALQGVKDTFYKLPFDYGFTPTHGNMNIDDPIQCQRHGRRQAYALDLSAPSNTTLRAARGGRVVAVAENEPDKLPNDKCGGNFMWIRHQDGTFAVYFHMIEDGVDVGNYERVSRGQAIARVGSTGCSSGPHVHFSVHSAQGVTPGAIADWNGVRARYEYAYTAGNSPNTFEMTQGCHIPRAGIYKKSSNFPQ